jgi:hypothetical protein
MNISPVVAGLLHPDVRTCGRRDMKKLIVVFRSLSAKNTVPSRRRREHYRYHSTTFATSVAL